MKYYGKEKCRILKEIRAEIARQNDIEWIVSECKHKGNCKGTCPKCEQEVRQLEAALAKREALGKTVAVVGVSASIALSVTGCINPFPSTTDGVAPEAAATVPSDTAARETHVAVDGEMLPPETETAFDLPLAGVPVEIETETDGIPLPGEVAAESESVDPPTPGEPVLDVTEEETTEAETEEVTEEETVEDVLMGDVAVEGEFIEEMTTEEFEDELMGAPIEMPVETETEPETEEEPLMGEPIA